MKVKFLYKNYKSDILKIIGERGLTPQKLEALTCLLTCQFLSELSQKIEEAEPEKIVDLTRRVKSSAVRMILQGIDVEIEI